MHTVPHKEAPMVNDMREKRGKGRKHGRKKGR